MPATDEFYLQLLMRTIDRLDRSVLLSWALIAGLAVLHLTTVEGYIDNQTQIEETQSRIEELMPASQKGQEVIDAVEGSLTQVKKDLQGTVEDAFHELRRDFALLNLDVARVWCHQTQSADPLGCLRRAEEKLPPVNCLDAVVSGFIDPQNSGSFQRTQIGCAQQSQMQVGVRVGIPDDKIFNSPLTLDLALQIAPLPERNEALVDLLAPLIEEEVVRPKLDRIAGFWSATALPKIRETVAAAREMLEDIPEHPPELQASRNEAIAAVSDLLQQAASVEITPPQGRWWLFFEGKREAGESIISKLSLEKGEGSLLGALRTVVDGLEKATSETEGALELLQDTKEELEKLFQSQKAQLAEILSPIEAIPLDLGFFCRHFPLILLIAGIVFIAWPGERLRIVMLTRSLVRAAGQDDSLWHWLQRRRDRGLNREVATAAHYLAGLAIFAWAAYVAFRLGGLAGMAPQVWYELTIGAVLLGLAMLWRLAAVDRSISYL